ncbi:HEPN domain-containing protein [Ructibacterium gallinarum]|uniref:HEPN domain-containing protein n=1 Tax=Ructibacterium gallinarum TaxID=2779355 RepID=A0A9D5M289_9FIRM|nr:HEPN domain-containing protein [Ructibacterium gallinarum]MBE5040133.1 HEPN domain-containing protein [Ructibacterium gallinarum]
MNTIAPKDKQFFDNHRKRLPFYRNVAMMGCSSMEAKKDSSRYWLEQAEQHLKSAKIFDCKGDANRFYDCVFHCMRSILALEELNFNKHSGLLTYFRKEYIKTGKFRCCPV